MRPGFGEFQFAYGCLRELEDGTFHFPGWGRPTIPTQVKEAELGYDAAFFAAPVAAVFLQFKVSEYLTQGNASEWQLFGKAYYRFEVYPIRRSKQHNILVDLAKLGKRVYYCSPSFHTEAQYGGYHSARTISENSAFIECGQLPTIGLEEEHHLAYARNASDGYFCSADGLRVSLLAGRERLMNHIQEEADQFLPIDSLVRDLIPVLEDVGRHALRGSGNDDRTYVRASRLAEDVRARFGLALGFARRYPLESASGLGFARNQPGRK